MAEFVSEPIIVNEKPIHAVATYGAGFAPYFLALSLWIGALMMFFVITDEVDADINASPAAIVLGKFLSYGYIGIIQAVLASGIVMVLGLRPINVPLYFGLNILMSLVSIAIIQCLVFLLDQVGRILAIILLLLQLTACAGTFPLELVPKFFKVLNPFMPFTYYISGSREAIAGVNYAVFSKNSTVLVMVMVCFLVISVLLKGHADKLQKMVKDKKEAATAA
jgi:putative membrane protein